MTLRKVAKDLVMEGVGRTAYLCWLGSHFPGAEINSVRVHPRASLAHGVRVERESRVGADVSMGRYSYVMPNSIILNAEVGSFCSIGSYVSIGGWQHPYKFPTTSPRVYRDILGVKYVDVGKHVVLGDDVWVGDSAIVLSGTIGTGAIIAAGAVVTKDVPPYEIWGGVPARKIADRFPNGEAEVLMQLGWTEWPDERIRDFADFFNAGEDWVRLLQPEGADGRCRAWVDCSGDTR